MEALQVFTYNKQEIEFDLAGGDLMVNATEMAKIFGKKVEDFSRLDKTEDFIQAYLRKVNERYHEEYNIGTGKSGLNGKSRLISKGDIIYSRKKSGTWMHRILALKFAAWLNPDFEVWIYQTIDDLLFGTYRRMEESLRLSAQRKNRIEELKNALGSTTEFLELQRLELEERQASYGRTKENRNQLQLFRVAQ